MIEKTIVIAAEDNSSKYKIQKNDFTDFELIGMLECLIFDLKSTDRKAISIQQPKDSADSKQSLPETPEIKEPIKETNQTDLRTRIRNAIKAINNLGGQIEVTDLTNLTDQELQDELDELTDQYKRLKKSQAG